MMPAEQKQSTRRKPCHSASLSTLKLEVTGLGLNAILRSERQATNRGAMARPCLGSVSCKQYTNIWLLPTNKQTASPLQRRPG
jgi:hypothetical protein